jgi:hypothetical protein
MSTATELTGLVQIDVDRSLEITDVSAGLEQIVQRIVTFASPVPIDGKPAPSPDQIRKHFKAKQVQTLDKLKQALAVTDEESFHVVGGFVAEAAGIVKSIAKDVAEEKEKASWTHQRICDREAVAQAPYSWVKEAGDANMNTFRMKQKREAEEQSRKDQEIAQAEQRRLQQEADNKLREQRELEAKALQAKRDGDMIASREAAREALAAVEAAEILRDAAVAVVEEVQHAPAPMTKIAGRVEKWPWKGTVVDQVALEIAVGTGQYPREHTITVRGVTKTVPIFDVNPEVIEYYAKRLEANARIPGVKFEETLQTAQRTK